MRVFHKASTAGMITLINKTTNDNVTCGSTEDSAVLFHRAYCLVLEVPEDKILYRENQDIDAHQYRGYDEVRFNFSDAKVIEIIGSRRLTVYDQDLVHLANAGFGISSDEEGKQIMRELFSKLEITPVRKANYTREFLNI